MDEQKNERVRIAALGDLHVREPERGAYRSLFADIGQQADILVLTGDLTNRGLPSEAEMVAEDLAAVKIPIVAVLGNHDFESGQEAEVGAVLTHAGVSLLAGEPVEIKGVGFAGVKGFAGGFDNHMLEPWGEKIIKQFVYETIEEALRLESSLARLRNERKVAVLHYAPIKATVEGEPAEILPYLGSSRLAEPLCRFGVSAAFHGHAHHGRAEGVIQGVPVYNVSLPLMRELNPEHPFKIVEL